MLSAISRFPLFAVSLFALCAVFLTACPSTQRTLDPAGPYAGDLFLYTVDGLIVDFDRTCDDVLALAERNPQALATQPALAAMVEKIRAERREWLRPVIIARDAYATARTPAAARDLAATVDALRLVLEQLRPFLLSGGE